ncbi:C39 family peptidase [Mesobacillus subterraneus]|uniref:C39 family peptidase n=1 Tax=Mesobacillus subterraneus TaxID=285983 RepID=UPI00203AE69A|nr:C39 family peptidase [Mesobacillus subterraneus]MCM3663627.1 C39 family peptidase [Mesobacillus subterraneus]MCM3683393.1 C39 family peptidase [Mesobacillus subterraneus]
MYRKSYFIFLLVLLVIFSVPVAKPSAAEIDSIKVAEITETRISGTAVEKGRIQVIANGKTIGKGYVLNHSFSIIFSEKLKPSELRIKFFGKKKVDLIVNYEPAVKVNPVNDSVRILSGIAKSGVNLSASAGGKALELNKFDQATGAFEFKPSSLLQAGTVVTVISERNGVKSSSEITIKEALPPQTPVLGPISNLDKVISGQADKGSTVYIQLNNQQVYSTQINETNSFKIALDGGKPLEAGIKVTAYAVDGAGRKSGTAAVTVADKISPPAPKLNAVSDKSFSISGKSIPSALIYVNRNSKYYKTVRANSYGDFSVPMPLHKSGTVFHVYTYDQNNNKSPESKLVVTSAQRAISKKLYAPIVRQMPELNRGCEVTSLSMMLGSAGISSNKMTLALQVKKDPTPYRKIGLKIYFGNPNYGFVGNMYTFSKPGFGVFNGPIEELANQYMPNRVVNLSGQSFDEVLNYVSAGHPVWVITTSWFKPVPDQYWQTWYTPQGQIRITMKEHSVLITGYDSKYVYFNDPLDGQKNKAIPLNQFIGGWKQYGSQAISYY